MIGGLAALVTFGLVGTSLGIVAFFTIPLGFVLFIVGGNGLEKAIGEDAAGVAITFKKVWSSRKLCAAVGAGLVGLSILGMVLEPLWVVGYLLLPGIGFIGKALFTTRGVKKKEES